MLNLVEQISKPKDKIIIEDYMLRSLIVKFAKYNLHYKSSTNYYSFTNKYLEVYLSKYGNATLSLLSLPDDTERAITILGQLDWEIYSTILNRRCEIYKEMFILENRDVPIEDFIDMNSYTNEIKSMILEMASGIRIRLSKYENQFIISFRNYKDINDLKFMYYSLSNGVRLRNIVQTKLDVSL